MVSEFPTPDNVADHEVWVDARGDVCGVSWVCMDSGELGYLTLGGIQSLADENVLKMVNGWIVEATTGPFSDVLPMVPDVRTVPGDVFLTPMERYCSPIVEECEDREIELLREFDARYNAPGVDRIKLINFRMPGSPISDLRSSIEYVWTSGLQKLFMPIYRASLKVVGRCVSVDAEVADNIVMWAMASYFRHTVALIPLLMVDGINGCGKSALLKTLRQLSYHAMHVSRFTTAGLESCMNLYGATLLLDEVKDSASGENNVKLMGTIRNSVSESSCTVVFDKDTKLPRITRTSSSVAFVRKNMTIDQDIVARSLPVRMLMDPAFDSVADYIDDAYWPNPAETPRGIRGVLTSLRQVNISRMIKFDAEERKLATSGKSYGGQCWRGLIDGGFMRFRVMDKLASFRREDGTISYPFVELYNLPPRDIANRAREVGTPVLFLGELCGCEESILARLIQSLDDSNAERKEMDDFVVSHALYSILKKEWDYQSLGSSELASDSTLLSMVSRITTAMIKGQADDEREIGEEYNASGKYVHTALSKLGFTFAPGHARSSVISTKGALKALGNAWDYASLDPDMASSPWAQLQVDRMKNRAGRVKRYIPDPDEVPLLESMGFDCKGDGSR